jgi:hypothetical protein
MFFPFNFTFLSIDENIRFYFQENLERRVVGFDVNDYDNEEEAEDENLKKPVSKLHRR